MHRLLKSILPVVVAAGLCAPAAAQIPVPPLPHVEIHFAHSHPPHPRHEYRAAMPGPGYVWVNGFWDWQATNWIWIPGRWERPAVEGSTWVEPHYYRESTGYRYEPGHWSNQRLEEGSDYREWREKHHHNGDREHEDHDHDQR